MKNLDFDGLLNAVVYDLKKNGMYECPNVIESLYGGSYFGESTAEEFLTWDDKELEEAKENGEIEKVADRIVFFIAASLTALFKLCDEDIVDEDELDGIIGCLDYYIRDINEEMLFDMMYPLGMTRKKFDKFIFKCRLESDDVDEVVTKYEKMFGRKYKKMYGVDLKNETTKKMVKYAIFG